MAFLSTYTRTYLALSVVVQCCCIEAILELEKSGVLYACLRGPLNINCSTGADTLRWTVASPQYPMVFSRGVPKRGTAQSAQSILTNLTTLNISKFLNENLSLPLMSTIFTDNATADLNGTVVTCSAETAGQSLENASLQIILAGNNNNNNITPIVNTSEDFETDGVTVTLVWSHKNGVSYHVSVDPKVPINYTGRNSIQLRVNYGDTKYNVSVIVSFCGRNKTTFQVLNYMLCPQLKSKSDSPTYVYSNSTLIEGTIATISCLSEHNKLTGPNISTCVKGGKWSPDVEEIRCEVNCNTPNVNSNITLNYSSTLEDSLLTFQCKDGLLPDRVFTARCYNNGSWIPNPSSHVCATSSAANCGEPSPPPNGYILTYTSTLEGANVNIFHVCQGGVESSVIICNDGGQWEEVEDSTQCAKTGSNTDISIIIGGFLGGVVLLASGVVILITSVAIVVRRKGSSRKNIPVSSKDANELKMNYDYQADYSSLQRSVPVPDDRQADSKSEYSLLQKSDLELEERHQSKKQTTATTLVYADVVSFKQKPRHSTHDNRVEYAQLKGPSDKTVLQCSTFSDVKNHPVDQMINLDSLLIQLKPAASNKWYQLGEVLGVNKEILDKCIQYPSDQGLIEILDNWLRSHTGQPTWKEIAEAVKEIGLQRLALDLISVYETGKLPIEVDMESQLLTDETPPPIPPRQT